MFSYVQNGIGSVFSAVGEAGKAGLKLVGSAIGNGCSTLTSVGAAVIHKANDCASAIFNKVSESPIYETAKMAIDSASTQMTGMVARTAAKAYVRAVASDSRIEELREELCQATGSDALADTLKRLAPHVIDSAKSVKGSIGLVLQDDKESCGKILEAKVLEMAIEWAKKTDNRKGEEEEHVTMTLMTKLLRIAADYAEGGEVQPETIKGQFKEVSRWLLGHGAAMVRAKVEKALLDGELGQNSVLTEHVRGVAQELLANFGLEGDADKALSLEGLIKGLMNDTMKDGIAKLFFHLNSNLLNLDGFLDGSKISQLPIAELINDFCKNAAGGASETDPPRVLLCH